MTYWILEYVKVLVAYLFLLYVWPNLIFRKFLKGKGLAYRFAFSSVASVLLLNTMVLMLGLVHLLNPWIFRILFYGPLLGYAVYWVYQKREGLIIVKHLLTGICSPKRFCIHCLTGLKDRIKAGLKRLWDTVREAPVGYGMLMILIVFGMIFFSYGAFHEKYFGASDLAVHHSWIYQLTQGNIFSAGVYPEGMHCFIYSIKTLFGIDIYSVLLFLAGIHIMTYLVAAYLLFKEFFAWKFSGLLAITLFLVLELDSIYQISSMSRLQWTLPQEFGFFAMFLCVAYLLKFFKEGPKILRVGRKQRIRYDENLLVFGMALAVTIAAHFYVTIIAFFLCVAITIYFLTKVFRKKYFYSLVISVCCGVLVAVMPMAGALASGMEFQGSINWALGIIEGDKDTEDSEDSEDTESEDDTNESEQGGIIWEDEEDSEMVPGDTGETPSNPNTSEKPGGAEPTPPSVIDQAVTLLKDLSQKLVRILKDFYKSSYAVLYTGGKAEILLAFTTLGTLLGLILWIIGFIKRRIKKGNRYFFGYLHLITMLMSVLFLYACSSLGLPELIAKDRVCSTLHLLMLAMVIIPLDFIFCALGTVIRKHYLAVVSAICCLGIYFLAMKYDVFHSYLYNYYTRYPAAVEQTQEIIDRMEPETYTIVSSVDELYQVIENGFHEELIVFLDNIKDEHYTLPTEYVFLYVEKQPLSYSHIHFLQGPTWLAYSNYDELFSEESECPQVVHSEISKEAADSDVWLPLSSQTYFELGKRTVAQSRMYEWCQRFIELYPGQMEVVYEDEAFVCYGFRQNPARLFELAIPQ